MKWATKQDIKNSRWNAECDLLALHDRSVKEKKRESTDRAYVWHHSGVCVCEPEQMKRTEKENEDDDEEEIKPPTTTTKINGVRMEY